MLQITQAQLADAKLVAALFNHYRIFYEQQSDEAAAIEFISNRLANKESVIFLATYQHQPAGFVQLYPIFSSVSMQRTWLLNDLFVHPNYRQQGIGEALLQQAAVFGKATTAKWLLLQTAASNLAAQKLYEKNGWIKQSDYFYELAL
jgi:ribosomal protein S18 acetylase RimI-like enzyme